MVNLKNKKAIYETSRLASFRMRTGRINLYVWLIVSIDHNRHHFVAVSVRLLMAIIDVMDGQRMNRFYVSEIIIYQALQ